MPDALAKNSSLPKFAGHVSDYLKVINDRKRLMWAKEAPTSFDDWAVPSKH